MLVWKTYILFCNQKTFYVGITSNIEQRLNSHKEKRNLATKEFSDLKLVYTEEFQNRKEAERREKQLKGWSFAKKESFN
jgi:putative endonuclease